MNSSATPMVLVIGATGSIGRLATAEAIRQGFRTRALVRDASRAGALADGAEVVIGDLTQPDSLGAALDGVDAVILTHASDENETTIEQVSYGGVRNVLAVLTGRQVRIVLMSAVGVTARTGLYNTSHMADWKRRAERLVRASGHAYTIVRPGWFDENLPDQLHLILRQGDRHHAGNPTDGVVARRQIAQVLIACVTSEAAERKTFELVAGHGPATTDFDSLFAAVSPDAAGSLDGPGDANDMPLDIEPEHVTDDLTAISSSAKHFFPR